MLNAPVPPEAGKVDGGDVADKEIVQADEFSSATNGRADVMEAPLTVTAMDATCTEERLVFAAATSEI